jgi:hypothetical protein
MIVSLAVRIRASFAALLRAITLDGAFTLTPGKDGR